MNIAIDSSYAALRMKGLVKCEEAIFSFWTCETSPRAVEIWLVKNSEFVERRTEYLLI